MQTFVPQKSWRAEGSTPVSFVIRKKGIKRKRSKIASVKRTVAVRPKLSTPGSSKKTAKTSSTPASSAGANSKAHSHIFVDISEIINVKKAMNNKDKNAKKRFVEQQIKATQQDIDPERKGPFHPHGLYAWLRENDRIQTRARFTELYDQKPLKPLSWLRYGNDGGNQSFEYKLSRYQLQLNLAHKSALQNIHGDSVFAIDKMSDLEPTIILHLYQSGFSINSKDKNFQRYSLKNRALLQSIDAAEIPSFSDNLLQHLPLKYYNGCLIAEINDYRFVNRWSRKVFKRRVLLKPTGYTLSSDALSLASQYKAHMIRRGTPLSREQFEDVYQAFEEKLIKACGPLLCFEPSPRVLQAATVANYNSKVNLIRKLSRDELYLGMKFGAGKRMSYRHYIQSTEAYKSDEETVGEIADAMAGISEELTPDNRPPSSFGMATMDIKDDGEAAAAASGVVPKPGEGESKGEDENKAKHENTNGSGSESYPFSPRARTKSHPVRDILKKIRSTSMNTFATPGTEFSKQLFRQASFVHYTQTERPAYIHGLLLRDPVMTSKWLAGQKQPPKGLKALGSSQKDSKTPIQQARTGASPSARLSAERKNMALAAGRPSDIASAATAARITAAVQRSAARANGNPKPPRSTQSSENKPKQRRYTSKAKAKQAAQQAAAASQAHAQAQAQAQAQAAQAQAHAHAQVQAQAFNLAQHAANAAAANSNGYKQQTTRGKQPKHAMARKVVQTGNTINRAGAVASPGLQMSANPLFKPQVVPLQRVQSQGLPTATAHQSTMLLGTSVQSQQQAHQQPQQQAQNNSLAGITEAAKAQTVVPTAYNSILKFSPQQIRQQALMSQALLQAQQKQLSAMGQSMPTTLQQLQHQYLLMAAYRNHQLSINKNLKKQQMLNGSNAGKPK